MLNEHKWFNDKGMWYTMAYCGEALYYRATVQLTHLLEYTRVGEVFPFRTEIIIVYSPVLVFQLMQMFFDLERRYLCPWLLRDFTKLKRMNNPQDLESTTSFNNLRKLYLGCQLSAC